MNHIQRMLTTLNHKEPDKVPIDFGNSVWTGIHAKAVEGLRNYYGLEKRTVKVWEPYQFLGGMDDDLLDAMGVDTIRFDAPTTAFGFRNGNWKEMDTWWGQTVLVSGSFNTTENPDGGLHIHPEGDTTAVPSGFMPETGYFFDSIIRQNHFNPDKLNVKDNQEEFAPISEADLSFYKEETKRLKGNKRAAIACFGGTSIGDIFAVPAPWMKDPKGIRDITEWYVSTAMRQDYLHQIFEYQCDMAIQNLTRIHEIVGDTIKVMLTCGTDFGTQTSQFCSKETYRSLYMPYHKKINQWIHENTTWKSMKHSCGSVEVFMEDFIGAGFDIINPVQISATGMDSKLLKKKIW